MTLNNKTLDDLDLTYFYKFCADFDSRFHLERKKSGEAHYRLLAYLSLWFSNNIICDIGTNKGTSALCLSYNQSNKVYSFDLKERHAFIENSSKYQEISGSCLFYAQHVHFIIGNFYNFSAYILNSFLILLDINHDGLEEQDFYSFLEKNNYNGFLLVDDIHFTNEMKEFWNNIKRPKYDITKYGNRSGTGLVDFSGSLKLELL